MTILMLAMIVVLTMMVVFLGYRLMRSDGTVVVNIDEDNARYLSLELNDEVDQLMHRNSVRFSVSIRRWSFREENKPYNETPTGKER